MAETREQLGNLEEEEHLLLEAVIRGLVKREQAEKTKCVL
jgi:hypothetical protein